MKVQNIFSGSERLVVFILLIFMSATCFSQDDDESPPSNVRRSKLSVGLYVGTLFSDNNTAWLYDGYGYDVNGQKNDFSNSLMNRNINYYYGGGNSQTDQIAAALGVNHGEWSFDETDMPASLKYDVAFALGLHTRYSINSNNAIVLNFTASKLAVGGEFTITLLTTSQVPQQPGYINYKTFAITGSEQRFIFQVGYQHIFGEDNGFNFFAEGGAVGTLAKFLKNQIAINNLTIDLAGYYTQPLYNDFRLHHLSGIGFGAWGGLGLTTSANAKTTLQFVYNPSFEIIPLAENTAPHLQHYIGLRFYYNLWRRVIMKESF